MLNRNFSNIFTEGKKTEKTKDSKPMHSKIINTLLYILVITVPWLFTTLTQEYYEITKNYFLIVILAIALMVWGVKTIILRKVTLIRTPLDIGILLFLLSSVLSTLTSINQDTSIWGYSMRLTGGLISNLALILLFYFAVNNINSENTGVRLLKYSAVSISILAGFVVLKSMGILDPVINALVENNKSLEFLKSIIFNPQGNPNTLLFLFIIALPLVLHLFIVKKQPSTKSTVIGYICMLSLLIGASMASLSVVEDTIRVVSWIIIFGVLITPFIFGRNELKKLQLKTNTSVFILIIIYIVLTVFTFSSDFRAKLNYQKPPVRYYEYPFETGWAVINGVFSKYSLQGFVVGSGLDTYAYNFPQSRPISQNLQPNWFENYTRSNTQIESVVTNTGLIGLASYIIFSFIIVRFLFKKIFAKKSTHLKKTLVFAPALVTLLWVLSYFLTYHTITLSVYFWLIAAIMIKLYIINDEKAGESKYEVDFKLVSSKISNSNNFAPYLFTSIVVILAITAIFYTTTNYIAEAYFNKSIKLFEQKEFDQSYDNLVSAVKLNTQRDYYHREIAAVAVSKLDAIAKDYPNLTSEEEKQKSLQSQEYLFSLINSEINKSILLNPNNHENWQRAAAIYKTLTQMSQGKYYGDKTLYALQEAIIRNPNNPDNYLLLGYIYQYNTDETIRSRAEQVFFKAYDLQPSYALTIVQYGQYLEYVQKYNDALTLYKVSLEKIYTTESPMNTYLKGKIEEVEKKQVESPGNGQDTPAVTPAPSTVPAN